ncbi:UNVERIFIED_CONTAM: hypothetical protein GTU68_041483 [Idotea baltica]|nr:hypothetical protein [Idotea baltica]
MKNAKKLATVCEEANCPNINECWSAGTATIMLMGNICTRACKFCSIQTGNPKQILNKDEPTQVALSIQKMNRDDLLEGGVTHYAKTIETIKKKVPQIKVEALIPDFNCQTKHLDLLLNTEIDVIAQNIETTEKLTHIIRDLRAGYWKTLNVLYYVKCKKPKILTKTSIMLGLGEKQRNILSTMDDLQKVNVDLITFGQYMQPTQAHAEVKTFVTPKQFQKLRAIGLNKGFLEIASGPLVRSSYRAEKIFKKNTT